MSLLGAIGLVLAIIVGIFAVLVLVGASRLRAMRKTNRARIDAVGAAELATQASFFGQASQG